MSLQHAAQHLASKGRGEDSVLVHMTPGEVHGLQALAMKHGGSLTVNPETGLVEAGFLKSILPMVAGFALGPAGFGLMSAGMAGAAVGGLTALATGSLSRGLMAGLGAYGGSGLSEGLAGAGAGAVPGAIEAGTAAGNAALANGATQAAADAAMREATSQFALEHGAMGAMKEGVFNLANPDTFKQAATMGFGSPGKAAMSIGTTLAPAALSMMQGPMTQMPGAEVAGTPFQHRDYGYSQNAVGGEGDMSSREKEWMRPTYQAFAQGGIASINQASSHVDGGRVGPELEEGGFVIPADVTSALGNGSSSAGLEHLARRYGAVPIHGTGDGQSDSIPTSIEGRQPARVAREEAYIPAKKVAEVGGSKKLYAVMDKIRERAHGKKSQQRKINPEAVLA